jgi:hypothetical protein
MQLIRDGHSDPRPAKIESQNPIHTSQGMTASQPSPFEIDGCASRRSLVLRCAPIRVGQSPVIAVPAEVCQLSL